METFFFRPDRMAEYYNCSGRTYEEWEAFAMPNPYIGLLYASLGFIFWITYFPFMVVFVKSDIMKHSCYKIMCFLGIIDMLAIPLIGFFCAYFATVGVVYCMHPTILYVAGLVGLGFWCSGSTTCMILGFNRCLDLCHPPLARALFGGNKTYVWLLIPTLYFLYIVWFHTTAIFTSTLYAFFFDPFIGMPERNGLVDSIHYPHTEHSIHNIVVVVVLFASYAGLCLALTFRTRGTYNVQISKLQRQTFLQSTLICGGTFIADVIYVYMQFFYTPVWVVVIGQVCWLTSHGIVGIIYFFFNPTMRREAAKIFCSTKKGQISQKSTASAATAQTKRPSRTMLTDESENVY